jgi:hypothetical protein
LAVNLREIGVSMFRISVAPKGIRESLNALKSVEPELMKDLRKEIKTEMTSQASPILEAVPVLTPLKGMGHAGRTSWGAVKASVGLTPNKLRKTKDTHPLVSIRITSSGSKVGYDIAEVAGAKSQGQSASGRAMITKLNQDYGWKGKAGRFAFKKFLGLAPAISKSATEIIDKFITEYNRRNP